MPSSRDIASAEIVFHFTTRSQALSGVSPSRPPLPRCDWKPMKRPTRCGGIPSAISFVSAVRYAIRTLRLPTTGPREWTTRPFG